MIYSNYKPDYESYKERNLYYKIFGGYLFNELLPDYEKRKKIFFDLLTEQVSSDQHFAKTIDLGKPLLAVLNELSKDDLHVSFDYHPKQVISGYPDHGEVSDIIIWGKKYFISIEVKYLSDWTFEKDIKLVQSRVIDLGDHTDKKGIQVLLLKETKWLNNIAKQNQPGSNYKLLKNNEAKLKVPLLVITWEQILGLNDDPIVRRYLLNQLKRELPKTTRNA
jgi:hypothetical protein